MVLDNIRRLCLEQKKSILQLERDAHVGKKTIQRWDVVCPSADKLARVAAVLGVTVDELLKEDA